MRFIVRLIVNALALWLISYIHFMGIHADTLTAVLIGGLVLGIANAIIRPILMVLTCPLVILTLGLFTLIINGLIFKWVLNLVPGFHVPDLWAAIWGAIAVTVISWIASLILHDEGEEKRTTR
jgi:putative membrane protein